MAKKDLSVNRITVNSFAKGMDYDSPDNLLPQDNYRYAENIKIVDGVATPYLGTGAYEELATYVSGEEISVIGNTDARAYLISNSKSLEVSVIFYYTFIGGASKFNIGIIPSDDQYGGLINIYSEFCSEDYKTTTVDAVKIGQDGYDTVYFVDNIRPPRKVDLKISSIVYDEVTIELDSLVDLASGYTVNLNINLTEPANNSFRVYVRAYRTSLGPSHPSTGSDRLKFVDFVATDTTIALPFFIAEAELDTWTFEIFYTKIDGVIYSDFRIGNPYKLEIAVGVLPESQRITVKSGANRTASSTQVDSWDFIYSGTVYSYYIDTPTIVANTTKIYKSNKENPSNLVAAGYHQLWITPTTNQYILVNASGVIIEVDINNSIVVFDVVPPEYQSAVDSFPNNGGGFYNRLDTVEISLPTDISGESFKRAIVNSEEFLTSDFSYILETKSQLTVQPVYRDPVIIRIDNVFADVISTTTKQYEKYIYEFSLETPIGESMSILADLNVSAFSQDIGSPTNDIARASAIVKYNSAITNTISVIAGPSDENNSNSDIVSLTIEYGKKMTVELLIDIDYDGGLANASANITFNTVVISGGGLPTEIRDNGTLIAYSLGALAKTVS